MQLAAFYHFFQKGVLLATLFSSQDVGEQDGHVLCMRETAESKCSNRASSGPEEDGAGGGRGSRGSSRGVGVKRVDNSSNSSSRCSFHPQTLADPPARPPPRVFTNREGGGGRGRYNEEVCVESNQRKASSCV